VAENTYFQTFPYNRGLVLRFSNETGTTSPGIEVGTSELIWYICEYVACTSQGGCTSVSTLSVLHGVIVSVVHPWVRCLYFTGWLFLWYIGEYSVCTSQGDCFYGTFVSALYFTGWLFLWYIREYSVCTSQGDCFISLCVKKYYFFISLGVRSSWLIRKGESVANIVIVVLLVLV
jgi:hypothetical protein